VATTITTAAAAVAAATNRLHAGADWLLLVANDRRSRVLRGW